MTLNLTSTEARVVYSVIFNQCTPRQGYSEWRSAIEKLRKHGGGKVCCRDCTSPGTHKSRLGGYVCEEHAQ